MVLGLGLTQIVVLPHRVAIQGHHRVAVLLLLHPVPLHVPHRECGVGRQLTILLVKLFHIAQIEHMVHIPVLVSVQLHIVQQTVTEKVGREYLTGAVPQSATQLVRKQHTVLFINIVFSSHFHTSHIVLAHAVLLHTVLRPRCPVPQTLALRMAETSAAAHSAVSREKQIILLSRIIQIHTPHHRRYELLHSVGNQKRKRRSAIQIHHTVQSQCGTGLLFQLDVDNTAHTLGVVFCRRVGDNLHILNRAGGYLFQQCLQIVAHQLVGAAVYKHFHIR